MIRNYKEKRDEKIKEEFSGYPIKKYSKKSMMKPWGNFDQQKGKLIGMVQEIQKLSGNTLMLSLISYQKIPN